MFVTIEYDVIVEWF